MENLIGQSLGRYHILEQLGEGGMAVVYKAYDTRLERNVAIKIIMPYRQHTEKFLQRFQREARALAKLSHPNILKIFDYGEHDDTPYLVMEYIQGGTLSQKLTGKPMDWQTSARLLAQVARALESAHQQSIIHRDVKPANILISNDRELLLSDFGIAKLIAGDEETVDLTGSGVGIGTPQYMAPEQGFGSSDERSDVYSLGVIYYEMVTGHKPFEADTPMAIMLKKNTEPLPRPTQYNKALPEYVENVLIKSLARDPNHRYVDMGTFARALENLASQNSTEDETPNLGNEFENTKTAEQTVPEKTSKKYLLRSGIGCIALFFFIVIGAGGFLAGKYFLSSRDPTDTPASSYLTTFVTATPGIFPNTNNPTRVTETPTPTSAPVFTSKTNGQWIAFNSRMSGNENIYLIDIQGNNLTELTKSTAHDLYPSWSPDGSQIVYQTNEGGDPELAVIDIATKEIRKITSNTCSDWGPSWSPDGEWFTFYSDCDGERNIYKIRKDGNEREQLTFSSGSYSWFPSWSPDGTKITFSSNRSGKYHIYVMNADGSDLTQLARGCVSYFSPDGTQILYGVYCTDTDELWLMNSDGSNQHQITDGSECKNATWSPDGTKIIFGKSQTTKDGPFALFIMSLNDPDPSNWMEISGYEINGESPVWQP